MQRIAQHHKGNQLMIRPRCKDPCPMMKNATSDPLTFLQFLSMHHLKSIHRHGDTILFHSLYQSMLSPNHPMTVAQDMLFVSIMGVVHTVPVLKLTPGYVLDTSPFAWCLCQYLIYRHAFKLNMLNMWPLSNPGLLCKYICAKHGVATYPSLRSFIIDFH